MSIPEKENEVISISSGSILIRTSRRTVNGIITPQEIQVKTNLAEVDLMAEALSLSAKLPVRFHKPDAAGTSPSMLEYYKRRADNALARNNIITPEQFLALDLKERKCRTIGRKREHSILELQESLRQTS